MLEWIDSHCHVQWLDEPDTALDEARAAGVVGFVCVGTDLESSRAAVALAERHDDVKAAVGLHPHDASKLDDEWAELAELAGEANVVAVGETGFDLHYRHSPVEAQEEAFRRHVDLAKELDRALVIHSRAAWDDTFRVLEHEGVPERTIFHCFTGGEQEATRALALHTSLSFSGIVSFANAHDVRAAASSTPLERALVETDAPYLAPAPHRGEQNVPAYVTHVGNALARAMSRDIEDVATSTVRNTRQLFRM